MSKIKTIKSYMTPFPFSIDVEKTLQDARYMMMEHNIRHLPVSSQGRLVGILSDRDLKWALGVVSERNLGTETDIKIDEIYQANIYQVDFNESLDNVVAELAERQIGSAIVMKEDKLAGIFTTTDACRCFAEFLREKKGDGNEQPSIA